MKVILIAMFAVQAAFVPRSAVGPSEGRDLLLPPPSWAQADPADSLYRAARRALTEKDYETAARLFDAIVTRHPRSDYAPDALYWKGFALYRNGNLDDAVTALEAQAKQYPKAATINDASALLIQIQGQLAQRGDPSARIAVSKAAASSDRGCADMEMQIAALDALQQMDSERVMPLLSKVLARREACSTPLRKNALFILAQKSGSDREKLLLSVAKNDPSPQVRSDAVFHLSQAKSDAAVEALADLLLHSDERAVRGNALFALAQNRSERARNVVKQFALSNDAPLALRNDAIFHLAQDPVFLMEMYPKVTEPEVRGNILFHIASRAGPETNKWLVSVIVDPKETMEQRKNALFHLASRKESADELSAVYDRVPVALKKDIIFHIAQRGGLDKLIAIAKSDPNQELRKEALFHIGQSKDPRALKALEEIVNP